MYNLEYQANSDGTNIKLSLCAPISIPSYVILPDVLESNFPLYLEKFPKILYCNSSIHIRTEHVNRVKFVYISNNLITPNVDEFDGISVNGYWVNSGVFS